MKFSFYQLLVSRPSKRQKVSPALPGAPPARVRPWDWRLLYLKPLAMLAAKVTVAGVLLLALASPTLADDPVSTAPVTGSTNLMPLATHFVYLPLIRKAGWAEQTSGTSQNLQRIDCPTAGTCFAVGENGTIRATTNGGATWVSQDSGTGQHLFGISCPTASTCFAVGENGTIRATTNGGASWSGQSSGTTQRLRGISCASALTCLVIGGVNTSTGVRTTTGGSSWTVLPFLGNTDLHAVSCPDTERCTVVGLGQRIIVFVGEGIYRLYTAIGPTLYDVDCPTSSTCLAVGENGAVLVTTNGGGSFGSQSSGTTQRLGGVGCSGAICAAVGQNETIRITMNGGSSWAGELSPQTENFNDVDCPEPGTCFAVGAAGTILKRE